MLSSKWNLLIKQLILLFYFYIESELPNWLKVLAIVACYTQSDKDLQLATITTLFDLIR